MLLVTIGVPFDDEAVTVAVDAAIESGEPLIVANVTRIEPLPLSVMLGYDALEEFTPEVAESTRRPAQLARDFGLAVERLRIRSPRPVAALLELIGERGPGLVVFGPDRRRVSTRGYRRAVAALRTVDSLLWLSADAIGEDR